MGIDKLFSSLQEETDRMANTVDKVFDDTDRAIKGVDVSNLTKEQEDALEHQIEKEVADSIQEAKSMYFSRYFLASAEFLPKVRLFLPKNFRYGRNNQSDPRLRNRSCPAHQRH